ncbi:hypothetical protein PUN28_008543 [Cardiocondyla obscurior]|uniref:Uncharacterized protein n=1 Tax=Cardiocondyla obscurior TaxID=286306 RepID=A0AAW2FYQ7_9HYME
MPPTALICSLRRKRNILITCFQKTLETSIMPLFLPRKNLTCERAVDREQITCPRRDTCTCFSHKRRGCSCKFHDSLFGERKISRAFINGPFSSSARTMERTYSPHI